jgi:hypothetical protein
MHTTFQPEATGAGRGEESRPGDCFVVVNRHGQCWDGAEWVDGWFGAIQFRRPAPAYELCEEAAREAGRSTGIVGLVCYIPAGTASPVLQPFPDYSAVDLRQFGRGPLPDAC